MFLNAAMIQGFTYQAEILCLGCTADIAEAHATDTSDYVSDQGLLESWAHQVGIDPTDTSSYDSDSFPKPFEGIEDEHEVCYNCGLTLVEAFDHYHSFFG